jgi:hypothetical protein
MLLSKELILPGLSWRMHNCNPMPVIKGLQLEHPLYNKPAYGFFWLHEVSHDYVTKLTKTLVYILLEFLVFNIMHSGFTILT